ncbi:MAG: hypothetical protein HWQ38_23170 [Nostoc sp. NMS7]|nr:hypothetical protein [Nostoc sp. NMS7]MBN3949203.1 hypothetical protein [Nostoc sp. NMS7]
MSTTGYAYAPMTMEMLSAIANGLEGCCNNTGVTLTWYVVLPASTH